MKGERTRQHILERAIDVASLEGLEGLTIGRLADELEMSKSGLFAHFGSKEDLQLAAGVRRAAGLSASHGPLPAVAELLESRRVSGWMLLRRRLV